MMTAMPGKARASRAVRIARAGLPDDTPIARQAFLLVATEELTLHDTVLVLGIGADETCRAPNYLPNARRNHTPTPCHQGFT
jgi:hypothetical protein